MAISEKCSRPDQKDTVSQENTPNNKFNRHSHVEEEIANGGHLTREELDSDR